MQRPALSLDDSHAHSRFGFLLIAKPIWMLFLVTRRAQAHQIAVVHGKLWILIQTFDVVHGVCSCEDFSR